MILTYNDPIGDEQNGSTQHMQNEECGGLTPEFVRATAAKHTVLSWRTKDGETFDSFYRNAHFYTVL